MLTMLTIGLMSGTSLDGVDGVLVEFGSEQAAATHSNAAPRLIGFVHHDFEPGLRAELAALQASVPNELARSMQAANGVARAYANVVHALLERTRTTAANIRAIGAHGQTVRHAPAEGYTVQLLNAALLAQLTHIAVVHDLRSADIAQGGQGAPLLPAMHAQLFRSSSRAHDHTQIVCNLGGIANITVLPPSGSAAPVIGFDTGPASCLMDAWAMQHLGTAFDESGAFAANGTVNQALLNSMLAEPYFHAPAPKSTGRDLFNAAWLAQHLKGYEAHHAADVQATLAELTARTVCDAIILQTPKQAPPAQALWLCGGGAFNTHLLARLAALSGLPTRGTSSRGVDEQQVEALAFAWFAYAHLQRLPGNLSSVTGARAAVVLGSFTPAGTPVASA